MRGNLVMSNFLDFFGQLLNWLGRVRFHERVGVNRSYFRVRTEKLESFKVGGILVILPKCYKLGGNLQK